MSGNILFWRLNFNELYQCVFREYSERYQLTELEMEIILFLKQYKEYNTARDICTMHGLPKSNVSNSVRMLERKGFIKIQIDGDNRKIHRLWLTDKSLEVAENLQKAQTKCFEITLEGISQEERDKMYRLGERCNQNILNALKTLKNSSENVSQKIQEE